MKQLSYVFRMERMQGYRCDSSCRSEEAIVAPRTVVGVKRLWMSKNVILIDSKQFVFATEGFNNFPEGNVHFLPFLLYLCSGYSRIKPSFSINKRPPYPSNG